jgi:hypothetical protein
MVLTGETTNRFFYHPGDETEATRLDYVLKSLGDETEATRPDFLKTEYMNHPTKI